MSCHLINIKPKSDTLKTKLNTKTKMLRWENNIGQLSYETMGEYHVLLENLIGLETTQPATT